jgi:dTDP-4-amino-4,6-dideoxygalactose transaminase
MIPARSSYLPFGQPNFSDEEIGAVSRVLRSGWIGMGPETLAFEQELAAAVGAPHVVTVNTCTSALFLSLLVHGIGQGDEVICPSLTWCSTANAALYLGAKPVFCDVDPGTLCVTPSTVRAVLTPRTKAVMVVHFGGLAANITALRKALPKKVVIIEDAAHAFGARFADGGLVGSSGNTTCFSFYANKNLSTGEGGAVALFDPHLADRIRSLRQHALHIDAWKRFSQPNSILLSNQIAELGYKMNYTDLHAAIGRVQLRRQTEFIARRLAIARTYQRHLRGLKPVPIFQTGVTSPEHARHLFTIQLSSDSGALTRDELLLALRARNIGATIHYAPLHTMPLFCGRKPAPKLPVTERIARSILTLPISASMSIADAAEIAVHVLEILKHT